MHTVKPLKEGHGPLFFLRMGVFSRLAFGKLEVGLLFKMNAKNDKIDDYMKHDYYTDFQPFNMFKCQTILKKNTNFISYCLKKKSMASFRDAFLFEITQLPLPKSRGGSSFQDGLLLKTSEQYM